QGAVLRGGYEAGLPGCRGLDLPSVDARETPPRRLGVRAIYGIEDRIAEVDPGGPDPDSRVRYRVRRHDRRGADAGRHGGVRPPPTCPTIRAWHSSGGSTSPKRPVATRHPRRRSTGWRKPRTP